MHPTTFVGSKITFSILLIHLFIVADLCQSKTSFFIHVYVKIHDYNLIYVREGPQGKKLTLCTYYTMYAARKLKFLSRYSLEISKAWFLIYF